MNRPAALVLTAWSFIMITATGVPVLAAADEDARLLTLVYPYNGDEASFEKFRGAMGRQLGTLGEDLCGLLDVGDDAIGCVGARTADNRSLINFGGLKIRNAEYGPGVVSLSANERAEKWLNPPDTLQIWEGGIEATNASPVALTTAFLGKRKGKLPVSITLRHPISIENNAAAKNSHMALTLYVFALDVRKQGFEENVVMKILAEARSRALDLDSSVEANRRLLEAIDASLAEATP